MHVTIRRIGNSQGIVIPKPMLLQAGLEHEAELTVEDGALVLRRPNRSARQGWAQGALQIAEANDDHLVLGDLANDDDERLTW
jgi:antitoxin MazE